MFDSLEGAAHYVILLQETSLYLCAVLKKKETQVNSLVLNFYQNVFISLGFCNVFTRFSLLVQETIVN